MDGGGGGEVNNLDDMTEEGKCSLLTRKVRGDRRVTLLFKFSIAFFVDVCKRLITIKTSNEFQNCLLIYNERYVRCLPAIIIVELEDRFGLGDGLWKFIRQLADSAAGKRKYPLQNIPL